MRTQSPRDTPLRILESVAGPDGTTKFVDQVTRFSSGETRFIYFSWGSALFRAWDVFHVHWPESLVRARSSPLRALKAVLTLALLLRLSITKAPIVRTLHNVHPHTGGSRFESWVLRRIDQNTTLFVTLNDATPVPTTAARTLILHGDYVAAFAEHERSAPLPGQVCYFGRIEPYKGVGELIRAFRSLDDDTLSLRIVGRPDPEYSQELSSQIRTDPRISADLRFVSDQQLVREITASELVVLPYRDMHNSGALLVSLSLGLPTLAPESEENLLVQAEVGHTWLRLYSGNLETRELLRAIQWAQESHERKGLVPPFDRRRAWREVATQYEAAFRRARRLSRLRRPA